MNGTAIDVFVSVIIAILGSTGLWKYLETRKSKLVESIEAEQKTDCDMKELLIALAKAQICHMATIYIERGWITNSEAEVLEQTFTPYHELGGNGAGEVLYKQAIALPRRSDYNKKGDKSV